MDVALKSIVQTECSDMGLSFERFAYQCTQHYTQMDLLSTLARRRLVCALRDKYSLAYKDIAFMLYMNENTVRAHYTKYRDKKAVLYVHEEYKRIFLILEEDEKCLIGYALNDNYNKMVQGKVRVRKEDIETLGWRRTEYEYSK